MLHHGFLQGTSPSVLVATYRHQLKIKVSNNVLKPQNHMSHGSFFKLTAWRKCFMISNTPQPTTKLKWKRDPVQALLLPSKLKLIECIILFSSSFLSLCFISSLCLVLSICLTHQKLCPTFTKNLQQSFKHVFVSKLDLEFDLVHLLHGLKMDI